MKNHTLRSGCRDLVDLISENKYADANILLKQLVLLAEKCREERVSNLFLEAGGDDEEFDDAGATDLNDASNDEDADADAEGNGGGDDEDDELGNDLDPDGSGDGDGEGADEETPPMEDGDLGSMSNDMVELSCRINRRKCFRLSNKLANLKTRLNSKGLTEDDDDYVTFDEKIKYYAEKLRDLQDRCTIVVDQEKVSKRLDTIKEALNTLSAEFAEKFGDDDVPDVKSTDELDSEDEDMKDDEDFNEDEDADFGDEAEGEEDEEKPKKKKENKSTDEELSELAEEEPEGEEEEEEEE